VNYVHCQIEVKQEDFQQGCLSIKTKKTAGSGKEKMELIQEGDCM